MEHIERFGGLKWLRVPMAGIGASEAGALLMQIDLAHILPLVGLGITAIGTAAIGLWHLWQLKQIQIREQSRMSDLRVERQRLEDLWAERTREGQKGAP